MKYTYAYKTSDGTRHEATIVAESREAVFAALRAKGIKAIKVVAADGSKANGEIRGVRKRVVAASVFGAVILAVVGTVVVERVVRDEPQISTVDGMVDRTARRQMIGDAAIIEKGIKTGWAAVFMTEGERFLASFAIPGIPPAVRATTEDELRKAIFSPAQSANRKASNSSLEERQIRAMVEGLKEEARRFVSKGGSVAQYARLLVSRQEEEISYYARAKMEIENAQRAKMPPVQLNALWEKRNESLRQMGVKLIPMPE